MSRPCGQAFDLKAINNLFSVACILFTGARPRLDKMFARKIILEFPSKDANMSGGQSSGVRSSSFTAMNAGVSSEAIISAMAVIYF